MSWIDCFFSSWSKFLDFSSESSRKEFWIFALCNLAIFFLFFLFITHTIFSNSILQSDFSELGASSIFMEIFSDFQLPTFEWKDGYSFLLELGFSFLVSVVFWLGFVLTPMILYMIFFLIFFPLLFSSGVYPIQVLTIYMLVVLLPYLALSIRRMRNAGYGPLIIFVQLIPFLGPFIYGFLLIKLDESHVSPQKYE